MNIFQRLKLWNPWWQDPSILESRAGKPRSLLASLEGKGVFAIVGPRRVGKTTLLFQLLRKKGGIYIPYQDPFLRHFSLEEIVSGYVEEIGKEPDTLFIDEIQFRKGWQQEIRVESELGRRDIYITGSYGSLLKGREARHLVGRIKEYKLYPLSFQEFLHWKTPSLPAMPEEEAKIKYFFNRYLLFGGFPSVALSSNPMEEGKEIVDHSIGLDIIERYGYNPKKFYVVFDYLLSAIGRPVSLASIERRTGIARETVSEYIQKLLAHHILLESTLYSRSIAKKEVSPKKYYVIDPIYYTVRLGEDQKGKLLENWFAVFLDRAGIPLNYGLEGGKEFDFVVNGTSINITFNPALEREKAADVLISPAGPLKPWDLKKLLTALFSV